VTSYNRIIPFLSGCPDVTLPALEWPQAERLPLFDRFVALHAPAHGLKRDTARLASADASFRRYIRIDAIPNSMIVMDAPPERENCQPFADIAALFHGAQVHAPTIHAWDKESGFMLLTDLGTHTVLQGVMDRLNWQDVPARGVKAVPDGVMRTWFGKAIDALIPFQLASKPGVLPPYDDRVLQRELMLFSDWYVGKHRAAEAPPKLQEAYERIKAVNLNAPQVYVHRDFMPRNLMLGSDGGPLGVLDFQDALYGPVTYDIACLMRDAFLTWDDEFVMDVTVRYWERARKAGLITNGAWGEWESDFGAFWRAVDYMALQRHLKVAGIFARLTLRDGKPKYLADAPRFIDYIVATASRYRELKPLLDVIDALEGTDSSAALKRALGLPA
jgi:N-acetylmuramate 1-kinase